MSDVVVLCHLVRPAVWEPVRERLELEHRVTFLDVPGFGDTPLPPGPLSIPAMALGVRQSLVQRGLLDAHLVGLSMAGSVALEAARIGVGASATAISPPGFWSRLEALRIVATIVSLYGTSRFGRPLLTLAGRSTLARRMAWSQLTAHPDRLPDELEDLMVYGAADVMRHLAKARHAPAVWDAIVEYHVDPFEPRMPVTVAWGDRDVFTSYRGGFARAQQVLPEARHVTLAGCGHIPLYDDPDQVVDTILSTVASV